MQVFDQKKFKKKDQGFLGVINIRIGDVIELADGADGMHRHIYVLKSHKVHMPRLTLFIRPDAYTGLEKVYG